MAKQSLKERLAQQKKDIKNRTSGGKFNSIKEGVTRARPAFVGAEKDFSMEVDFIYLNKELGGFVSPTTFGEKCAFNIKYNKMKDSPKESDRKFAARLKSRLKFMAPHIFFNDTAGKEPKECKLLILTPSLQNDLIDLFLDDDEAGDFTDPINGYDIKYKREGKGMLDTRYGLTPCKPTKVAKEFRGPYDLEKMVRDITPTYEETKELLAKFMSAGADESDDTADKEPSKKKAAFKKKKSKDL